jgi:hypothetical protein
MLNQSRKVNPSATETIPDPWTTELPAEPTHPSWQFPLDPSHALASGAPPDGILSPAGDPQTLQIPIRTGPSPAESLLSEELKVDAQQNRTLWEHVRDALTLLWWRRDEKAPAGEG